MKNPGFWAGTSPEVDENTPNSNQENGDWETEFQGDNKWTIITDIKLLYCIGQWLGPVNAAVYNNISNR